ncbi:hypothetical protein GCM10023189_19040 [Nibrella saemangeumensis]|uniref:Lipoprotein n=1 Tax=Nibrella saemangeumensis TaxID=1084526 RepID=A0ABP8MQE7_9BACT
MRENIRIVALWVALIWLQVACQQDHPDAFESLQVTLIGQGQSTLPLSDNLSDGISPIRQDSLGGYYRSQLRFTETQLSQIRQTLKEPVVLRVALGVNDSVLTADVHPLPLNTLVDLPGEQLIPLGAVTLMYRVLDYQGLPQLNLQDQQILKTYLSVRPYGNLLVRFPFKFSCYITETQICARERCLSFPSEFNFERIEILNKDGGILKTLTSEDCAVGLSASLASSTSGPLATFNVRAYIKRLNTAPTGPTPTYSLRYANVSAPSREEASSMVTGDFSSLATLAVGATQMLSFQLSWNLGMGSVIGPKDFFVVNNATYDAILAKGGCTSPNTMQYYAEDRFRFNVNGAPGGCL